MPRPVLLVAHPGHELQLFGWLEACRPLVCILSDGSGSAAAPRIEYSRRLVEGAGGSPGPVFGWMSDQAWYRAILAGDAAPFLQAAELVAQAAGPGARVVADPVEGYNPLHDLCSAVADRVATLVHGTRDSYPLIQAPPGVRLERLPPDVQRRKAEAVAAYAPLAEEAARMMRVHPDALASEGLADASHPWPADPGTAPEYERIGAERSSAGVYADVITYARHVRPLALRVRGSSPEAGPG